MHRTMCEPVCRDASGFHGEASNPCVRLDARPAMSTILLVEDSDVCAYAYRRALEKAGYDVVVATTISDALEKVAKHTFAAALVDSQLPDGDGTVLQLPCPRVLMSADSGPGVMPKGSDAAGLVAAVRHAIARKWTPDSD
jgi:Response regulator receiver domain